MEIYNIALDGPSGSGKSTVAKALSQKLGILYLDTGAMYRATAVKALRLGVDPLDERAVAAFLPKLDLDIRYKEGTEKTFRRRSANRRSRWRRLIYPL